MTEVPLSQLKAWYEAEVRASTLEIVRYTFQSNFPGEPTSSVSSLGVNYNLFEAVREELGDAEFRVYLQCQMSAWKEYHKDKPFYLGYCIGDKAGMRYLERRETIMHAGYHSFGSEIYRAVFPNECEALGEYFRRWLTWEEGGEEDEPNWPEIKASFAPSSHPFYVTLSCNYETAVARGDLFFERWLAGRKRLKARKLAQDSNEYDRACLDALLFTACQITPRAKGFTVFLEKECSFPYQIALQLYARRKEILAPARSLRIRVGDGSEKIDGLDS